MPRVALYYPHWGISDPRFMFDALLYWDRLACIVPYEGFEPSAHWPDDLQREAAELHEAFVTGVAPTPEIKGRVHDRLEALLATEAPAWCRAENLVPSSAAVLAVRKVSSRTINMLSEGGWLASGQDDLALVSRAASGLLLGALAEEMASETMPAVTDEPATFRATCNTLLRELQARQGIVGSDTGGFRSLGPSGDEQASEMALVLAGITQLGIGDGMIEPKMLRRLRALCLDSGFREQRERFRAQVDGYISELRERPLIEHGPLRAHWELELDGDRRALKRELRAAGIESIVEKEGLVATGIAALAGAGASAAAGPAGVLIGVGLATAAIADRVQKRRNEVKEEHWTSWLVAAASPNRTRALF